MTDPSALMAAVPMPLVLIGGDARVVMANPLAEELFGSAAVGRHYITALRQPALLDCIETALKQVKTAQARFPLRGALRETIFLANAAPLAGGGVLLSLDDVGHVHEAGQMRRDFVANVSHELRTPLTALLGFIETLRGPARDDAAARERFLGIMATEAGRMSRLIRDLLSLSRVESEERMRPQGRSDVAALVTSATMTLGPVAAEAGVTLHVSGAQDALIVPGDADQLLQIFANLIENAVKYGRTDVFIDIARVERDPVLRAPAVRIEVRDNGIGIDPLHVPRLTERFYRVDSHRSREMGGTGLGLAIVKHIINRHRGRLRIESTPGQGSRFIVVLPRGPVADDSQG
ncbi:MAG: two-component sensor histidine kinase [Rhodobacter sp.]|nr:two-component sensor histidine kinase [Rhodobacter sp.]